AHGQVLTAWPASDELTKPPLGYVSRPLRVLPIENFSAAEMLKAAQQPEKYDVALIFSTKHHPRHELHWNFWEKASGRYYDYHQDLTPEAAAQLLGGALVWQKEDNGLFAGIIDMQRSELAERASPLRGSR
ncbi:MAG TPA: glycosyltransferase, partial [Terriglobales bacterium]